MEKDLRSPIQLAVELVGGQSELARRMEIKPQAVQQWVASNHVPANRVLQIEQITQCKVTRHQLRPDLYPRED